METLQKKYGQWTAIAMVVGIVIGSGIFFKADDVLYKSGGNIFYGLLAWCIGAIAMIFGALVFAEIAQRVSKNNGIVDYAEEAYGKKAGYLVGWFKGILYYIPLTAVLGWVSALYTTILFDIDGVLITYVIALIYIVLGYTLNYYSPVLAGKFQVSATIIKLIPLLLIAIVGTIYGIITGVLSSNIASISSSMENVKSIAQMNGDKVSFPMAIVACAFAYEGWIVATSVNSEIIDSKKNLPRALVIGTLVIFIVYVLYYLGVASVLPTEEIINNGDASVGIIASKIFGQIGGKLLLVFVIISCLGTLNGLILGSSRVPYSLAVRGHGPFVKKIKLVNKKTSMPMYSALFSFILTIFYLGIWYTQIIDISELPIVSIYVVYLLLYGWYMVKFDDLGFIKRFVYPTLASFGALIIIYGGVINPRIGLYLGLSLLITLSGLLFYRKNG